MLRILKNLVLLITLAMLIAVISGCGNKSDGYTVSNENKLILRLAETQSPNYPSTQGAKEFAKLVEQKSGGRIKVKVYDSGKLGDETSVIEQVQFGGIDLARVNLASLAQYSPRVNSITLPYVFRSSAHMWKVLEGPVGDDIKESLLKEKITCLSWYEGGARSFYNSKREVKSIDDLKGLKLSVQRSPMIMDLYSHIGISLVPTKTSDIYSALQAGLIDGVEGNIIEYYTSRHFEIAKYLFYDEHARIPEVIIGSRVTMMQLSKNDQAIIEQAARESAVVQRQAWLGMEKEAFKMLNDMGVYIIYADDKSKERFLSKIKIFHNSFTANELAEISIESAN